MLCHAIFICRGRSILYTGKPILQCKFVLENTQQLTCCSHHQKITVLFCCGLKDYCSVRMSALVWGSKRCMASMKTQVSLLKKISRLLLKPEMTLRLHLCRVGRTWGGVGVQIPDSRCNVIQEDQVEVFHSTWIETTPCVLVWPLYLTVNTP